MHNVDAALSHLRAGGFIRVQDKTGSWLLCSTRQAASLSRLSEIQLKYRQAFILIDSLKQLYDYVMRFSELAWDIAEESEKALLIWYNHPKELPQDFKDGEGNVGVMVNRCKSLQPLLQKLGNGLFCLQLSDNEDLQALPNVLPLPQDGNCRLAPERIMRLSAEGDVKFLKY